MLRCRHPFLLAVRCARLTGRETEPGRAALSLPSGWHFCGKIPASVNVLVCDEILK